MEHRKSLHVLLLVTLFVGWPSRAAEPGVRVSQVESNRKIYHSPQTPGYSAWCTLWRMPGGELRVAFQRVTGPVEKPTERKNVTVILGSADEGATWKSIREIPARSPIDTPDGKIYAAPGSSKFCGHGMAVLDDGTMVTGLWAGLVDKSGFVQRSTDEGKTWSSPIGLRDLANYKTYPTQIKKLRDGRLIAVVGTVKQADAATAKFLLKEFFESRDGGKSWKHFWTMPSDVGACEESDFVELDSGDLLFSHRCEHYDGNKFLSSNRLQSVWHKKGDGWDFGPATPVPMPHSGFPCLLKLPDGSVLHIATDGVWRTPADLSTWTKIPELPGSPYYPQALLLKDGRVLVVGHVGSDDEYGKVDQSIVAQTYQVDTNASSTALSVPLGESVLLLDDHAVASTKNLTQEFFPAKRHPANPVIRKSEPWEGIGPYVWGNRLLQDPKTGTLRLWYGGYEFAGNAYRWGLATSQDGLNWNKPDLGVQEVHGKPAWNCLPLGPHAEKGARSIARDPRPTTPDERRFLGVRFTYDGELVSFSPDGIHWTEHPNNPVWHVPSDTIDVMWDDRRSEFVAYFKMWELEGTQLLASGEQKPFRAYCSTFTPTNLPGNKAAFEAPITHFKTGGPAEVTTEKFVLRAEAQAKDDGGGSSLAGAWHAKRVQVWAHSPDGVHWSDEQLVLRADDKDPPTANIQFMFVMQHGGYYLGFLTLHDEAGHFDIQLALSADGIHFKRPWRKPWLGHGPDGAFDMGMVLGPADPILTAREMWFPYGGSPITHDSPRQDYDQAIGLAITRLDGFASWRSGDGEGELVTRPFRFAGDRLFVNAAMRAGGTVRVEVLDESGRPVPGFSAAESLPLKGDTLAEHGDGWARWTSKKDLKELAGKAISLRFIVHAGDLFAFRVADAATQNPRVPRAAMN